MIWKLGRRNFFLKLAPLLASVAAFGRGLLAEAQVHHDPLARAHHIAKKSVREGMFKGGELYARAEFKVDDELWKRAWLNIAGLRVETDGTVEILWRDRGFNNTEKIIEIDLSDEVYKGCSIQPKYDEGFPLGYSAVNPPKKK